MKSFFYSYFFFTLGWYHTSFASLNHWYSICNENFLINYWVIYYSHVHYKERWNSQKTSVLTKVLPLYVRYKIGFKKTVCLRNEAKWQLNKNEGPDSTSLFLLLLLFIFFFIFVVVVVFVFLCWAKISIYSPTERLEKVT